MADAVNHPAHYTAFPVEVIEIIKSTLGPDGFRAYCFGNEIKYRMRAGLKGEKASEDLDKAMTYKRFREVADEDSVFTTQAGTVIKFEDNNAQVEADTVEVPQRVDVGWGMDELRDAIFGSV